MTTQPATDEFGEPIWLPGGKMAQANSLMTVEDHEREIERLQGHIKSAWAETTARLSAIEEIEAAGVRTYANIPPDQRRPAKPALKRVHS